MTNETTPICWRPQLDARGNLERAATLYERGLTNFDERVAIEVHAAEIIAIEASRLREAFVAFERLGQSLSATEDAEEEDWNDAYGMADFRSQTEADEESLADEREKAIILADLRALGAANAYREGESIWCFDCVADEIMENGSPIGEKAIIPSSSEVECSTCGCRIGAN